jgi:LPXTG-motif cell wall-anchored protein
MRQSILRAVLAALALSLVMAPAAGAYWPQTPAKLNLTGPKGTVRCDRSAVLTATFRDTGTLKPIRQQRIKWRLNAAESSIDTLQHAQTITNRQGKTTNRLIFGPKAGPRLVSARAEAGLLAVVDTVRVKCAGGLPPTFPGLPGTGDDAAPAGLAGGMLALLAIVAGLALLGRRRLVRR